MDSGVQNVVLLTIDALRADHVSAYGYDRETTPFLDSLADEHTRFEYAYASSSHTRESIHAILTGKPPLQACTDDYRLRAETVASRLSAAGFSTGGFYSNPYASRAYGYEAEFDTFDDDLYFGSSRVLALAQLAFDKLRNRHYAWAGIINERSLSWLDSLGVESPSFCGIIWMSTVRMSRPRSIASGLPTLPWDGGRLNSSIGRPP